MKKLIRGLHRFQSRVFDSQRALFQRLAVGQDPEALFITCSDSRINPHLLTQTRPGDLFVMRNAGNLVPPAGVGGGEAATIEFAVTGLGIRDVIICGHSHCGAMHALFAPETLAGMPMLAEWLKHADETRRLIEENYTERDLPGRIAAAIGENVLVQLEHLRTHPAVQARLDQGTLNLHAWVYEIESGQVLAYDHSEQQFRDLTAPPGPSDDAPRPRPRAKTYI